MRDQQDFALNHKASENFPQEHDEEEIDRQIQADQYSAIEARKETEKDLIRYEQAQKLAREEKSKLEKQYKKLRVKIG